MAASYSLFAGLGAVSSLTLAGCTLVVGLAGVAKATQGITIVIGYVDVAIAIVIDEVIANFSFRRTTGAATRIAIGIRIVNGAIAIVVQVVANRFIKLKIRTVINICARRPLPPLTG